MRVLLSSIGRRGYLVKYFKEALGGNGQVWGADYDKYSPAFAYCDNSVLFPKVSDPSYVDVLIGHCRENDINMVVPLIDPELEVLAAARQQFEEAGIMAVVSPPQTIEMGLDKYLTYKFGKENGIEVPVTALSIEEAEKFLAEGKLSWPVVVKPRKGSASVDITYCHNETQLKGAFDNCPMPMIQEHLNGAEYGYDIFNDKSYRPISVYCKKKLAMRAGETDKAISTDDTELISLGLKIAENIKLFGPMDVDVMIGSDGPKLLELNPRFGGGYPCAHLCGADFPAKLISIYRNEPLEPDVSSCPDGVYMLKQDEIISPTKTDFDSIDDFQQKLI